MSTLLFLCLLSVSYATNLVDEDYIHWFLKTHQNPKIDPCDNFYRHVCPVGISRNDTLGSVMADYIRSAHKSGGETLQHHEGADVQKMAELLTAAYQKTKFAIPPTPSTADVSDVFKSLIYEILTASMKGLSKQLPIRIKLLVDLKKNPQNLLYGVNFTRILQINNDVKNIVFNKVKETTDQYSPEHKSHMEETMKKITITTAFAHETDDIVRHYIQMLKPLSTNIKKFTCDGHIANCIQMTKDLRNPTNYSILALLKMSGMPASENQEDHVTLSEALYILSFMPNTSLSTVIGQYAFAIAHELGHSFVIEPTQNGLLASDMVYVKQMNCLRRVAEKSCILWGETICESGEITWGEDGPDVIAVAAAYELLKKYLGNSAMKENEYDDLKITKEQIFFYSATILWCKPYAESQHQNKGKDEQSSFLIRMNSVFSMMPEFHNAFNCKKHQLMVQPDRCTFFNTGKANEKN